MRKPLLALVLVSNILVGYYMSRYNAAIKSGI